MHATPVADRSGADAARSGPNPWEIWIDTGGTFTDCLARDPIGRLHRAKVLSTSAVRGTVREQIDPTTLWIDPLWRGHPELVKGFAFHPLGYPAGDAEVIEFDAARGRLRLGGAIPPQPPGARFELRSPEEAPILAARMVTGCGAGETLPPIRMRLATTRGTNALLERAGAEVVFFVTRGFQDLLRIGTQQRPDLFTLRIATPSPLHARVIEVTERVGSDGSIVRPLDEESVVSAATDAHRAGLRVAAVSLLNAYRNDAHERRLEERLRGIGFEHVSISSRLAPTIGHLHRSETTVANAYLGPLLGDYLGRVRGALPASAGQALHLMTSAGGLLTASEFDPKDSLLSGPAGGVVAAAAMGRHAGFDRIIAFDMGGTSTDVSRYDRQFDYVWSHRVGDVRLLAPALAIETVAAGGGSICTFAAGGLRVGPESAGAHPGPACYGAGGPLTVTDCNLLLGRIDAVRFGLPVSAEAALAALDSLRDLIERETGERPDREPLLHGLIEIADERMVDAIRGVSLRQGYDPTDFALLAFGGAGPQHACRVAERLGIRTVIVPPDAGLLSAWGLGQARIERVAERQILRTLDDPAGPPPAWLLEEAADLAHLARSRLTAEGVHTDRTRVRRTIVNLRLAGQDATVAVDLVPGQPPGTTFLAQYESVFGHHPDPRAIEVESLRVIASESPDGETLHDDVPPTAPSGSPGPADRPPTSVRQWSSGAWREVPRFVRHDFRVGEVRPGPCLIVDAHTTIVVDAQWAASIHPEGALLLSAAHSPVQPPRPHPAAPPAPAAVREQLFTSRFEAIVGQMGDQLRRTALSTNVKERLDFSCALLNPHGVLVANAPHIPVHLGALGVCVRSVADALPMQPGDVVITNHPAYGGSHLPDITVITPVHTSAGGLLGYVASRAHHAEIGGSRPGSMPPDARSLMEEGVVIAPMRLITAGGSRWGELEAVLLEAPYPTRAPGDNLADLRAQVAANHRGATLLRELAATHGAAIVGRQMGLLTDRAERLARAALRELGTAEYSARERLDDGSVLAVRVRTGDGEVTFDFSGTSGTHPGNLNATPAIVRSAVLYLLRLLIDEPLPLNEGLMRPVRIELPRCLLNPDFGSSAAHLPAVVGGNTEVSQRLVDTLVRALELAACSQGTMNNVLWGTGSFGYYETVAGGEGASAEHSGSSAVHTHMTNTRITDAEVLEHRFPVRVERFEIRRGSGGSGRWRGGDGIVREVGFLAPMTLSVLTQHRRERPFGMSGGLSGALGRQRVIRAGGQELELGPIDGCEVAEGDRLILETPGGGGWGSPAERP